MLDDEVWAVIDLQRAPVADLLEKLADIDWRRASLCKGWTVRDVAAHLTLQQLRIRDVAAMAVRHPSILGGVNRMIHNSARAKAATAPDLLIAEIRATIGSRRHNLGVTNLETLTDIVIHGQDIALPVARTLETATDTTAFVATRVWSQRGTPTARVFQDIPVDGLRLTADDVEWSTGDGPEVTGPIMSILLLLTGRQAGLSNLTGPGADELRQLLQAV